MENPLVPTSGSALATTDELARAADYARQSKSAATQRAYATDFAHFRAFCELRQVECMPAEVETVCAYLAHLADIGLKASTITRRTAAITFAHRLSRAAPPTSAEPVKAVLQGIRRTIGVAVDRKAPATAQAIKAMCRHCPDTPKGKRDKAVLLLGFAAAMRRSELVGLHITDIEQRPDGVLVHIRRSKTDQEGAGHEIAVPRGSKLKPVEALDAWLAVRPPELKTLFGISDGTVANIVKRYARLAKLDPAIFSGHSLRAGFVTSALESGADLLKVMDVTRHREVKTLKAYDRRAKAFKDHAGKGFL